MGLVKFPQELAISTAGGSNQRKLVGLLLKEAEAHEKHVGDQLGDTADDH